MILAAAGLTAMHHAWVGALRRLGVRPALSLLLLVAVDASSDPGTGPARVHPLSPFESRCQALPRGEIEVLIAPVEFAEDYGESFAPCPSATTACRAATAPSG